MRSFIVFILLTSCAAAQQAQTTPQMYIAAQFSRGPQWDTTKAPNAQLHFAGHGKNLQRLQREGKIAFGARFGEFGLVVFKTGNEQEVRALFSDDSLVIKNILSMKLMPFNPFYKGCIE